MQGEYSNTAKLLETSLMYHPHDIITLRLVQSCYIAIGDTKSVLNCLARAIYSIDENHHLYGHLLGMLSHGYLENGKFNEAEQLGNRAVERTRGRDVWALQSLVSLYSITGRTSEGTTTLESHQSKALGTGQQLLLFCQGCILAQKGNYVGAMRVADLLIASIENSDIRLISALTDATFLLWLIGLNKMDAQLYNLWISLSKLIQNTISNSPYAPIDNIASVMCLSFTSNLNSFQTILSSEYTDEQSTTSTQNGESVSEKIANGFRNWFIDGSKWKVHNSQNEMVQKWDDHDIEASQSVINDCASIMCAMDLSSSAPGKCINYNLSTLCPSLLKVEHSYILSFESFDVSTSWGEGVWRSSTSQVAQGLRSYASCNYSNAAVELNSKRSLVWNLGGKSLHRDIIEQTMIESFLRDEQFDVAKLLLCER